jgi:hypothetical protein
MHSKVGANVKMTAPSYYNNLDADQDRVLWGVVASHFSHSHASFDMGNHSHRYNTFFFFFFVCGPHSISNIFYVYFIKYNLSITCSL